MLFYTCSAHPTKYHILLLNSFPPDWYVIALLLSGTLTSPQAPFQQVNDEKTWKKLVFFVSLPTISRNTLPVVATSGFCWSLELPPSGDARNIIPAHHHGHQFATFLGAFVDCCLFACCPGGRWGNTEQVVAWCRCPVASGVALDMPHWAMPSVLLRRTAVAIKMVGRRGAFVRHCRLVCINIHSYKTMLWSIKTKNELT